MSNNREGKRIVDYEKTIRYFEILHEARFKVLAFLPLLAGAALAALTGLAPRYEFAVAVLGGILTFGLVSYDQRNTQIYDRLVLRAKFLERQLGFQPLPGDEFGGAFHCRPPLRRIGHRKVFLIWHSLGLAIVYSTSFSVWVFIGLDALYRHFLTPGPSGWPMRWGLLLVLILSICTFLACLVSILLLSQVSFREKKKIDDRYDEFRRAGEAAMADSPTSSDVQ